MKKLTLASAITAALFFNPAFADDDSDGDMMIYHVTITNTTAHHVITPPLVIAHGKGFHFFKVGDSNHPASEGLAILAESGDPSTLEAMVKNNPKVTATAIGSYVTPGAPYTVEIIAPKKTLFSVAGMLATTNDAFTAALNIKAPKKNRHNHGMGMTFDAGSEKNNEECAYIPGPPCSPESGNANMPGEGMVTVHNGIFGKADLSAPNLDWRGPTSMISIHNAGKYNN